jgi:hypothetical protein
MIKHSVAAMHTNTNTRATESRVRCPNPRFLQHKDEVREAVFRGDALFVEGQHDERNKDLDEAVGIAYKGKQSTAAQAVTLTSSVLLVGTLPTVVKSLKINLLAGATQLGKFANNDPAIVGNVCSLGKGMHYAYD